MVTHEYRRAWVQAVISRQAEAKTQLAAFGIVMSLSVMIEAPIMMMLARVPP